MGRDHARARGARYGSLYAFSADGTYAVLDTGYRVANGPAFSPDGSVVYHTDSARREIYAFDLARDGALENKRAFVRFAEGEGRPDGMTTDRTGNLWVAMWDGARVEKLSPEGTRLATVPIPTRRPTSCTFVDSDCTEMFVTSASLDASSEDSLAGGLYSRSSELTPVGPWKLREKLEMAKRRANRLGTLRHHPPRPLHVPGRYRRRGHRRTRRQSRLSPHRSIRPSSWKIQSRAFSARSTHFWSM